MKQSLLFFNKYSFIFSGFDGINNAIVTSNSKSLNVDQLTSSLQNHKKLKIT